VKIDDIIYILGNINDVASYFGDSVLKNTQVRSIAEDIIKCAVKPIEIDEKQRKNKHHRKYSIEGGRHRSIKYEDHVNDIMNHNLVSKFIDGSLDRHRKN